eukprot:contig_15930_g3825
MLASLVGTPYLYFLGRAGPFDPYIHVATHPTSLATVPAGTPKGIV